jgi:hypothetical protein
MCIDLVTRQVKRIAHRFDCALPPRVLRVVICQNALRRFVSIRGKVRTYRSDRGTNFIRATDDMKIDTVNVEDKTLK